MKAKPYWIIAIALPATAAWAQDWQHGWKGKVEYNCDAARDIVAAYGPLEFRRDGGRRQTAISLFQEDAPDCVLPYVAAQLHSHNFACPDSDCERTDRLRRWLAFRYGFNAQDRTRNEVQVYCNRLADQ